MLAAEGANEVDDAYKFSWEGTYERPWEAVVETADGSLLSAGSVWDQSLGEQEVHIGVKRGVLRSLFFVVDASAAAGETDPEMRPSRLAVMIEAAQQFVNDFFEQNPISTIAVLATRGGRAEMLTEPSCNPRQHIDALKSLSADNGRGEASLQNALELARESLHAVPSFTTREVLVLSASLSSCDPGDIFATISALKREKLRCSIYSLQAEVFLCRKIASDTGGEYGVPTTPQHLRDLLHGLVPPWPTSAAGRAAEPASLIRVGFPKRQATIGQTLSFAPGAGANGATLSEAPFICPKCSVAHIECAIRGGLEALAAPSRNAYCGSPIVALCSSDCSS